MVAAVKYLAGLSTGSPLETGETRSVDVTVEALDKATAYEGDEVTYTATVKDSTAASLPATFVADLELNGEKVIEGQAFDAVVYDQATSLLTLTFTVPATLGAHTVKLVWAEQLI